MSECTVKTMGDLKEILKRENVLQKYSLDKIGVFGSFARGEEFNDIDFYVDKDEFGYEETCELKEELERIIGIKIDVMPKNRANPVILYYAEEDMIYVTE